MPDDVDPFPPADERSQTTKVIGDSMRVLTRRILVPLILVGLLLAIGVYLKLVIEALVTRAYSAILPETGHNNFEVPR